MKKPTVLPLLVQRIEPNCYSDTFIQYASRNYLPTKELPTYFIALRKAQQQHELLGKQLFKTICKDDCGCIALLKQQKSIIGK